MAYISEHNACMLTLCTQLLCVYSEPKAEVSMTISTIKI